MVCSVDRTRWPVSAASSAISIVSLSRISPTRITFGACRKAARRASAKRGRIAVQLALMNDRLLVAMHEFDRIFDGEDVIRLGLVDLIENGRHR